jgi:TatD DNase family protein
MATMFDAHSHWQDERLNTVRGSLAAQMPTLGVRGVVVAGSGVGDWSAVADLADRYDWVLPSFGVHPWYVQEQPQDWLTQLEAMLQRYPQAGVGEMGLDRWIENADVELQQRFFHDQLTLARRLDRPASIHCLRAFGLLEATLKAVPLPARGLLLHSYGGPPEMVSGFVKLGAYFSVSPYFFHERKARQLETFSRVVPLERLLIETDAPDMWPPDEMNPYPLKDASGGAMNDPRNIAWIYRQMAALRGLAEEEFRAVVSGNFQRWWGG